MADKCTVSMEPLLTHTEQARILKKNKKIRFLLSLNSKCTRSLTFENL